MFSAKTDSFVGRISETGQFLTGEAARNGTSGYDPNMQYLPVANNAATRPFATPLKISLGMPMVIAKTVFDQTNGAPVAGSAIEASTKDAKTRTFWLAIPHIGTSASNPAGISEIDPTTGAVLRTFGFSTPSSAPGRAAPPPASSQRPMAKSWLGAGTQASRS